MQALTISFISILLILYHLLLGYIIQDLTSVEVQTLFLPEMFRREQRDVEDVTPNCLPNLFAQKFASIRYKMA